MIGPSALRGSHSDRGCVKTERPHTIIKRTVTAPDCEVASVPRPRGVTPNLRCRTGKAAYDADAPSSKAPGQRLATG